MTKNTLLLLDGNSLINRAYYGLLGRQNLTAPDGTPTGAVFAFLNMYLKYCDEIKPTHVAAAFDLKAPTFRHKKYDGYKATRKPMPDDLALQMPILKDLLADMGITCIEFSGYEADDIIGTLAKQGSDAAINVQIISGDKDSFQLADEHVSILQPVTRKGRSETERYDPDAIRKRFEIGPEQFIDLKAIQGDPSDNIPGVKGIGEKGATALLKAYGSLDNIYQHLPELKPAMRKKLEDNRDMAYLSQELATIDRNVPIKQSIEAFEIKQPDADSLVEKLTNLGFQKLISRFGLRDAASSTAQIFDHVVVTSGRCEHLLELLNASSDMVAVLIDDHRQLFYTAGSGKVCSLGPDRLDEAFETIEKSGKRIAVLEFKSMMSKLDMDPPPILIHDIQIAAYLLNQAEGRFDLSRLYQQVTGNTLPDASTAGPAENMSLFDDQKPIEQQGVIVSAIFEICVAQSTQISDRKIDDLAYQIEMPLSGVLAKMEKAGILIDESILNDLAKEMDERLRILEQSIHDKAGHGFNINSPKQLSEVLFGELGLATGKKSSSGSYSTDSQELERLRDDHQMIPDIIEFRQVAKLRSTYVEGLKKVIDPKDGRVHTTFNQTLTATGRLSSSDPNLQNIPIRMEAGQRIRAAFMAAPDHVLIDADYSQIELRLLAHLSEDEAMIKAFVDHEDIHTNTACRIFDKKPEDINPDMRAVAKTMNFSIVYGISDFGLARDLGVTIKLAHHYIKEYDQQYPMVRQYLNSLVKTAHEQGYIETMTGRRRTIAELKSPNRNLRQFGERAAMNTPIQGAAADMIKMAMVETDRQIKLQNLKARLILQVHDELIIEVPADQAKKAASLLKESMEGAMTLKVPLLAEVHIGKRWSDCK